MNFRARDQILDGPGHETLSRLGERCDPRGNMDGNTAHIVFYEFDLTRMEAGAYFYSQRPDRSN
jgi:hypothetical protein